MGNAVRGTIFHFVREGKPGVSPWRAGEGLTQITAHIQEAYGAPGMVPSPEKYDTPRKQVLGACPFYREGTRQTLVRSPARGPTVTSGTGSQTHVVSLRGLAPCHVM